MTNIIPWAIDYINYMTNQSPAMNVGKYSTILEASQDSGETIPTRKS